MIEALQAHSGELDFNNRNVLPRFLTHPRGVELLRELRRFYELNAMTGFPDQHLPAQILREMVPGEVWEGYFKFAFVRNPWDLVASAYHFLRQTLKEFPVIRSRDPDIAFLVESVDFTNFVRARPYLTSESNQLAQLSDARGNLLVDFVGRVETIESDFAEICRRTGISVSLPHVNKAEHQHYREYYTPETRDIIASHFARDIETFGYTF